MDAVRTADGQRLAVLLRALDDARERALDAVEDQPPRVAELEGERGVEDVRGGQPVVEPAPGVAEVAGDGVDERGHVVTGLALQLRDALRRRRPGSRPDRVGGLARDDADRRPRVERRELDFEPGGKPALVRPDLRHGRPGIAANHRADGNRGDGRRRGVAP